MTAKEKAIERFGHYLLMLPADNKMTTVEEINFAKSCASSEFDEILNALSNYDESTEDYLKQEFGINYFSVENQNMDADFRYWMKVKQELLKIN